MLGLVAPSSLVWLAQRFVTIGAAGFYIIAVVRIAFGLILISVAPASRAPRRLRVLGLVIALLGVAAALTGVVGVERGDAAINWWSHLGSSTWRLTGGVILALGVFVAYACAPPRRGLTRTRSRQSRAGLSTRCVGPANRDRREAAK